MSDYGLGNLFAKLFCSALPLAKKIYCTGFIGFFILYTKGLGSEKDFTGSVSQNLRSCAPGPSKNNSASLIGLN